MPRSALPQNYIINRGTLFENFENIGDWTLNGGTGTGTKSADTVNFRTCAQSLRITVPAGCGAVYATKVLDNVDLRNVSRFTFWVYCHTNPKTKFQYIYVDFGKDADLNNRMRALISSDAYINDGPGYWTQLILHKDDFSSEGTCSWNDSMIRLRFGFEPYTVADAVDVSIDDFRFNAERIPRIMIQFDDGALTAYSEGFIYANSKGIKGTHFICSDTVGTDGTANLSQLTEMYHAGWAIANHTKNHACLENILTQAAMEENISTCRDWLLDNGFTRSARHFALPGGTVINDTILGAISNAGMLTARAGGYPPQTVPSDLRRLSNRIVEKDESVQTVIDRVEKAVKYQSTVTLVFHELVETPCVDTQWSIAKWRELIDYLAARKIPCVTADEWYEGLTNPNYRSLPPSRLNIA